MKRIQFIRGSTVNQDAFIGNSGEITVDTQTKELRVHDGVTPGGAVIPNKGTVPTLSRKLFDSVDSLGVPGTLLAADLDAFLSLTAAGTYRLPNRSTVALGAHIWIYATVSGVIVGGYDVTQQIRSQGAVDETYTMNQFETIHLACIDLAGSPTWAILSSY